MKLFQFDKVIPGLAQLPCFPFVAALCVTWACQAGALRLVEPPYSPLSGPNGELKGLLVRSLGAGNGPELLAFDKSATQLSAFRLQPNSAPVYTVNHSAGISVVLDLNGDGKLDLVTISPSGSIYFRPASGPDEEVLLEGRAPMNARSVQTADVNGDGIPDLVITREDSIEITVLFGREGGAFEQFSPPSYFRVAPTRFSLADFNGDGNVDLLALHERHDSVDLYLGDGRGRLLLEATIALPKGSSPVALAVGDFNADSMLDFAVANMNRNSVSLFLWEGDGFRALPEIPVGTHPMALAAGDLDGDGRLDLVVANHTSQNLSVLKGLGGGNFQPEILLPAHDYVTEVHLADLDGNGRIDIACAGSFLCVYLNDPAEINERVGNGSFEGPGLARWGSSGHASLISSYGSAIAGRSSALLNPNARIWQVLETEPAKDYVLTFHHTGSPADLKVTLNGARVPLDSSGNWTRWEFTAEGEQTVLAFERLATATASSVKLDQVSVVPLEKEPAIPSTVEFLTTEFTPGLGQFSLVRTGNLDEPAYVTIEYNGGEYALEGFRAGALEIFRFVDNWIFIRPYGALGFAQGARQAVVAIPAGQQSLTLHSDFDSSRPAASTDVARIKLIASHNAAVGPKAEMVLSKYPGLTWGWFSELPSVRESAGTLSIRLNLSHTNDRVPHGAIRAFTTGGGTATAGVDFEPIDITIPPGEATALVFTIRIIDNQIPDGDKTIEVEFEGLAGGTQRHLFTIIDDDSSRILVNPQPHFPVNGAFANESSGQLVFRLVRQYALDSEISFRVRTRDMTAAAGEHYEAIDQRVTFAPGQTQHLVSVPLINDDVAMGTREKFFFLEFSEPSGSVILPARVAGVIYDDDPLLYIEILAPSGHHGDFSYSEADSSASIQLRLNQPYTKPIFLSYRFAESQYPILQSARAGIDFEPLAGDLQFLPGETHKTIAVPIINNSRLDGARDFEIVFNGTPFLPSRFSITIIDDEQAALKQEVPLGAFGPNQRLVQDQFLWVINHRSIHQLQNDAFPNPSFGVRGRVAIPSLASHARSIIPDASGGLLLLEWNEGQQSVTRILSDGSLESPWSFPSDYLTTSMIRQLDGKLVITAMHDGNPRLRRYLPSGALDPSFPFHNRPGEPKQIDPNGRVYLTLFGEKPGAPAVLARLAPDGSVDSSFDVIPATYGTFEFDPDGTRKEWLVWGEHYGLRMADLNGNESLRLLGRLPDGLRLVQSFGLSDGHRFLNLQEYCWTSGGGGCQYVQKIARPDGAFLDLGRISSSWGSGFFPAPTGFWAVDWQTAHHFSVAAEPIVGPETTEALLLASDRGLRLIRSGETSAPASVQCAWRNLNLPSVPVLQTVHFPVNQAEIWVKPPDWNDAGNPAVSAFSAFDLELISAEGASLSNFWRSRVVIVNEQSLQPSRLHIQRLSDRDADDLLLVFAGPEDEPYRVTRSPSIPWNTEEHIHINPHYGGRSVFMRRILGSSHESQFFRVE